MSKHLKAVLLAVLVTVIWSTSWVLIKIGLREIPALTFAGLRYFIAFLCLLPFLFQKENWRQIRSFGKKDWLTLSLFGLVIYTLAQGAQYLALAYLPSVTVSLLLNLSTLFVAFSGMVILQEKPSWLQWGGVFLNLAGITIYFLPVSFSGGAWLGYIFAFISLAANIGGTLQGREVNRSGKYSALVVTIVSMGIGSAIMLIAGISMQGLPPISLQGWGIVLLLAVVNTAFCFTMWNYIQQTLTAMEASLINSTMVAEVAALTWVFLGESLTGREIFGLALSIVGVLIVQINLGPRKARK
ncbi:MAG: DMT family transporter [Anaerolineaceae bacterium]|jgi:drug/metabolite transporter (DMT)-like permease|nr:DMT family transporter [Anaerolineaceae bacterium]